MKAKVVVFRKLAKTKQQLNGNCQNPFCKDAKKPKIKTKEKAVRYKKN